MLNRYLPIVGAVLAWFGPAVVWSQAKLEQKFPDGRQTNTVVKVAFHQVLTLNNQRSEVRSEQEMAVHTENGTRDPAGLLRQTQRIDALKAKLTMPGGVVLEFDSKQPSASATKTQYDIFLDVIKANAGATWVVIRDQDQQVVAVEGRDKIMESLDSSRRELLKKQVDPEFLREQANQEMLRIPARPLSKGESWELSQVLRMDAGQKLTLKTRYTYQGQVERNGKPLHQIDTQTLSVVYSVDGDAATPLQLITSALHPKTMEGVLYFDAEQGQVVESRETVQIVGDLQFRLGGNELAGQLELNMTTSMVVQ